MYSKDDIVRMLNEGTSIEDIAKSMTDTLNSAHDAYVAAQEEKERENDKLRELEDIVALLIDWVDKWHPNMVDMTKDVDCAKIAKEVDDGLEGIYNLVKTIDKLNNIPLFNPIQKEEEKDCASPVKDATDPFKMFFKLHGLS